MTTTATPTYHLVRPDAAVTVPTLDEHQQRAWSTTPAARCWCSPAPAPARPRPWSRRSSTASSSAAPSPTQVLALTFSRKAAEQLRDRVTARLGRTLGQPRRARRSTPSPTPWCGSTRPAELYAGAAAAAVRPRAGRRAARAAAPTTPSRSRWPEALRRAVGTRGFAREVQAVLARARERGLDAGGAAPRSGGPRACPECVAAGRFLEQYLDDPRRPGRHRLRRPDPARGRSRPRRTATSCGPATARVRRRVPGHRPRPGRAAAGAGRRRPRPHRGRRPAPVDLRLPRRRRARHPRLPRGVPARRRRARADVVALRTHPALRAAAAAWPRSGSPAGWRCGEHPDGGARRPSSRRRPRPATAGEGRVAVRTYDTERAEAEHLADLLRRAHLEDGVAWDEMAVLVRSGRTSHPAAAPGARRGGRAGRGRQRRDAAGPRARGAAAARRAARGGQPRQRRPRARRPPRPGPRGGAAARPLGGPRRRRRAPARAPAAHPREGAEPRPRAAPRDPRASWSAGPSSSRASSTGSRGARSSVPGALPGSCWTPAPRCSAAPPPRRCCGRCGRAPAGRRGCGARSTSVGGAARRAHRDLDAVCALFDVAARAEEQRDHVGVGAFLATPGRPADPRRHARRAGRARRRGPPADRPPRQGPGVAAGRRRPRPAGRLARPAAPLDAAPGRPDRRARHRAAGLHPRRC